MLNKKKYVTMGYDYCWRFADDIERVIMTDKSTLTDVQKIIVLDYGSQYNQLIARRIREFGVFSELRSHKITADEVREINPIGIVLSGGPNSVYADNAFGIDEAVICEYSLCYRSYYHSFFEILIVIIIL